VRDVACANVLALLAPPKVSGTFNVASGTSQSLLEMARTLCHATAANLKPEVVPRFRIGDVRHLFGATDLARERLGFVASVPFDAGMREFATAPLRDPRPRPTKPSSTPATGSVP
jgi:dTDP-L-rhamnose 4-epimerase